MTSDPSIEHGGWARPTFARKVHYFPPGSEYSACRNHWYDGEREPSSGGRDTRKDCTACTKVALGL